MLDDYNKFRNTILTDYDKYMQGVWKEYKKFKGDNDANLSFNIENKINNYRNQLKSQNINDVNNHLYTYAIGTMYMDICLLYTSPSPRDLSTSRMPSSA